MPESLVTYFTVNRLARRYVVAKNLSEVAKSIHNTSAGKIMLLAPFSHIMEISVNTLVFQLFRTIL